MDSPALVVILRCVWPLWDFSFRSYQHFKIIISLETIIVTLSRPFWLSIQDISINEVLFLAKSLIKNQIRLYPTNSTFIHAWWFLLRQHETFCCNKAVDVTWSIFDRPIKTIFDKCQWSTNYFCLKVLPKLRSSPRTVRYFPSFYMELHAVSWQARATVALHPFLLPWQLNALRQWQQKQRQQQERQQ